MSGFLPTRGESPVQTVRTIGRVAQMIVELRDEYVEKERDDLLAQIEQRLDDLASLRAELRDRIDQARSED
ncbi:MAG: hypothetical protein H0W23_08010 [Chloroflexia bacterium]|nr:hypothetical protein [Chloroflexia bacterium]